MGLIETEKKSFTEETIKDRELIIKMLRYEDTIFLGDYGKSLFFTDGSTLDSMEPYFMIHRKVLDQFDFTTTDDDVKNYRKIFSYYYKSPTNYDKDVISAVAYMRENKCIYYTTPVINIGDTLPDVQLLSLDGNKTNLLDHVDNNNKYTFIGAFSNS